MMKIGLFIPCYIDQFYPNVAKATLQLLEKLGLNVEFPINQTCCGQPMANSGMETAGKGAALLFIRNFAKYDYIVSPSGSCVLHVKDHFKHILPNTVEVQHVTSDIYEITEFLHDIIKIEQLESIFPHKVGLHAGCHGQRGLRLAQSSELNGPDFSKVKALLQLVEGLELVPLSRPDECCGFGGTFSVSEEAVSVKMGKDKLIDYIDSKAEVIASTDVSCMMHLEGLAKRQKLNVKFLHVAEILNGETI